jgi:hypothetical protein
MKSWQSTALALCCLTLALLIGGANVAFAQEVTATISGTVTDQSNAAVVGATVTAKSVERGTTYTGQSNDAGLYRIAQLPVGTYDLRVEKTGFQANLYSTLVLHENQVARIDVELKVGQVSQTVEVTGEAPVLKTEATQVDTIINAATNDNLPLASRNYVQLTLLAPGSVTTDPGSFTSGSNTTSYGSRPLINGNREQANNFLLDGMDNNQVSDNLLGYTPAPDAIQEFNLVTNNASAEFGNFMGGIVSVTVKSGTNSFHGDIWDYLRNDALNANSWSNNYNTVNGAWAPLPKAKLRWNMFGGTVGGPIIKNKLFFFADYQGQRYSIPASASTFSVFTAAERQGDFGALCSAGFDVTGKCLASGAKNVQLYNPCASFSQACTPSSTPGAPRQIFPFNRIPTAMMSPVAGNLFTSPLYPAAIGSGLQQNAVNSNSQSYNYDQGDVKIDWKPNEKDSISYRFTRANQTNPSTYSYALYGNGLATVPIYNTVGEWTRMINPSLVNNVRFGWSHVTVDTGTAWNSNVGAFGDTLGIGNGNPAGIAGAPSLEFGNSLVTNIGQRVTTQNFDDHVWQAEDSVTWMRGRHTIKMGGQFFHQTIKTFYAGNNGELGYLAYDGRFTSNKIGAAATGAGDGAADFFLGLPDSFGRGIPSTEAQAWEQSTNIFAFYGTDTWRATEKLTLNLGLRYEAHTPWIETNDKQANYNMATGNVDLANQNGASRALYNGFYGGRDFQPRVGFAYTPGGFLGAKTVIRGAFTISSYLEGTGTNLRLPINAPFSPAELNTQYNNLALPLTTSSDGIQGQAVGVSCAAPAYACYSQAFLRVWDPNVQPAIDDQWNLTIQHQFWGDTTFQIGYVGQHAYHLMVPFDYAQRLLNSGGTTSPSPFFGKNPTLYSVLGDPSNNGLGATVSGTQSNGTMSYNSLQAVVQKEMSHGLQYQVAYTYSKCMSDSTGYYGAWNNALSASAYWQNVYDQKAEWAPCYYDATHVLTGYAVYELPFGKGKRFGADANKAVNAVIGGWQVSPIVSFRTGWPMPVYGAADESGTFGRGARADCNGLPSIQNTPITGGTGGIQWFTNNNNFTNPAAGTFGDCAPQLSGLRGPHYTNVDLGLAKNFPITERFKLQFRTDFINAFNHVQFNAPNMGLGAGMGQITSAQAPRNIQFALKLYY